MPVLPVMATLAQPARNTLKPTDVSGRLTYPCTYRAVPETLVYWADVRPRAAGSVGAAEQRRRVLVHERVGLMPWQPIRCASLLPQSTAHADQ
jgi:hypothetical protein